MRDYSEVLTLYKECTKELDSIGIKYGNIVDLKINTRAESFWGRCKKTPNGYIIEVTERLLECQNDKDIKNTIIHELIHSCDKCMCHTGEWKRLAEIVNNKLGYNIKRTTSSEEKGLEPRPRKHTIKYVLECSSPNCTCKYEYARKTKVIERYKNYRCGKCDSKLNLIKL